MAFTPISAGSLAKFNSAASSDLLNIYETLIDEEIIRHNSEPKHKSFAPSQFRCPRVSWFRLRGTQPDKIKAPDKPLQFTADIGTACHAIIQRRLSELHEMPDLKFAWIDVKQYLEENGFHGCTVTQEGYETQIEMTYPYPIRFACDGIVIVNGETYLLEIKTSEFSSFEDLTGPKPNHIDQVKLYCTLLDLDKVLFLYQDRQHGGLKCFEYRVTASDKVAIREKLKYITQMVDANIAPEGLPKGDPSCSSSMCPYYKVCQEWGR